MAKYTINVYTRTSVYSDFWQKPSWTKNIYFIFNLRSTSFSLNVSRPSPISLASSTTATHRIWSSSIQFPSPSNGWKSKGCLWMHLHNQCLISLLPFFGQSSILRKRRNIKWNVMFDSHNYHDLNCKWLIACIASTYPIKEKRCNRMSQTCKTSKGIAPWGIIPVWKQQPIPSPTFGIEYDDRQKHEDSFIQEKSKVLAS